MKKQRKFFGWAQLQAAENAGIERETWGKYERGFSMPNGEVLISFMRMGIDVTALFSIKPVEKSVPQSNNQTQPQLTEEEQELLDCYRQASDNGRFVIMSVARGGEKKTKKVLKFVRSDSPPK